MAPDIGLANWFSQRAARSPERHALRFEGHRWTYADMQAQVEALAGRLQALGVARHDRVAFIGLNQPDFLFAMFASARLGAIFVPLNFRLTGPELAAIVKNAEVHSLIADAQHRPLIDAVRSDAACVRRYLTRGAAPGWLPVDDGPAAAPAEPVCVDPDDVAVLMYTSGTTGRPKGVMLTHANFWWNNINTLHALDVLQNDVTLCVAPLFHIGGLNVTTLVTLQKGGEVLLQRTFDPGAALSDVARHRVTTMFGVPAMYQFMAQHPDFAGTDLSSLRVVVCGGAPCPEVLLRAWAARGVPIQQGYGLTETAPMLSFLAPEYALSKIGSSGRAPLLTEIRLVDAAGRVVSEPRVKAEVYARGPNVMKGYWRNPEATAQALDADGWFRTGDVAYLDEDACVYVCDRVKDMIISGGENIYPAEVENVIYHHPAVAEAAVVGEPDEKWGETTVAVVVLRPGCRLELEQLREFAGTALARYKLPRRLEIVDALPRSASGKVLKTELRKRIRPHA